MSHEGQASGLEVRGLSDEAEIRALGQILGWSFGFPPEDTGGWLARAGHDNVRLVVRGAEVLGGLLLIPMGQWFGGRSVPMTGVAGVGVAPEHRGAGVARTLMVAVLRELAERGVALSTLYPATLPLYRGVGYELAGGRYAIRVRPADLATRAGEPLVRPVADSDGPGIAALYAELSRRADGYLDRGDYVWARVRTPRDGAARGFVVEEAGRLEGYVYVRQKPTGPGAYELHLTDVVAASPRAARRLLDFLGGHRSLSEGVLWHGSAADPLLALLPERGASVSLAQPWMTRVTDVVRALGQRGYPEGLSSELGFDVRDGLLPGCQGRFVLRVDRGAAEACPGGDGALVLDVRALAVLFTGHASPWSLARQGLLSGDELSLRRAQALFAGPAPAMPDMF